MAGLKYGSVNMVKLNLQYMRMCGLVTSHYAYIVIKNYLINAFDFIYRHQEESTCYLCCGSLLLLVLAVRIYTLVHLLCE